MTVLWPGHIANTDAAALREGHTGKLAGFWDAHFAHRLSLERRGPRGSWPDFQRDLQEEEQVQAMQGHSSSS